MTFDLRAARELCEKATPGPWRACNARDGDCSCGLIWAGHGHDTVARSYSAENEDAGQRADRAFIAASRTLVPQLLALVEELQASVEAWTGHAERAESARDKSEAENAPLRMALLEANNLVEELQRARNEACDLAIRYSTFTRRDERDELEASIEQLRAIGQRAEGGEK